MLRKRGRPPVKDKGKLSKSAVAAVLSGVMPAQRAFELAGMSPRSSTGHLAQYEDTVSAVRERLQQRAGVSLEDQVEWYKGIRDAESVMVETKDRIAAAKQIDSVLGYTAPQKVEVTERKMVMKAVMDFRSVVQGTGMSPMELMGAVKEKLGAVPGV